MVVGLGLESLVGLALGYGYQGYDEGARAQSVRRPQEWSPYFEMRRARRSRPTLRNEFACPHA
jgi:hypothetical protein